MASELALGREATCYGMLQHVTALLTSLISSYVAWYVACRQHGGQHWNH